MCPNLILSSKSNKFVHILQRLLIVPPELAYGSKGVQEIPPNATIEVGLWNQI